MVTPCFYSFRKLRDLAVYSKEGNSCLNPRPGQDMYCRVFLWPFLFFTLVCKCKCNAVFNKEHCYRQVGHGSERRDSAPPSTVCIVGQVLTISALVPSLMKRKSDATGCLINTMRAEWAHPMQCLGCTCLLEMLVCISSYKMAVMCIHNAFFTQTAGMWRSEESL